MLSHEIYVLVSCLFTIGAAIRVDWNTNKGPIVPPTPRTTVRPLPPYREPAPVWEDQSNDIPNPNPYIYVLPPPSRPRPATHSYPTGNRHTNYNNNNYGQIIPPHAASVYFQHGNGPTVAALSPQYVANVGIKYAAVVPTATITTTTATINGNTKHPTNGYYWNIGDKLQGKLNAKTKKYKAYEKVKYAPIAYPRLDYAALPAAQPYTPVFVEDQAEQALRIQQLPLQQAPTPFHAANTASGATSTAKTLQTQPSSPSPAPTSTTTAFAPTPSTPPKPLPPAQKTAHFKAIAEKSASEKSRLPPASNALF